MALEFWGLEGWYLLAFLLGIAGITQYFGYHSLLPTKKQTTALIGVGGLAIAGLGAGWWGAGLLGAEEQVTPSPGPGQIFDAQSLSGDTNVSSISGDTVKVEYSENTTSETMYLGDVSADSGATELSTVGFTFACQRVDTNENQNKGAAVSVNDTQVENADDTDSPWEVIVDRDTGEENAKISISGSWGWEKHSFLVSPLSSKDVSVSFEPNDVALSNVEVYDSVSVTTQVAAVTGGVDDTVTVKFLKVNEY